MSIELVKSKVEKCLSGLEHATSSSRVNSEEIVTKNYRYERKLPFMKELSTKIYPLSGGSSSIGCLSRCRPWNHADYLARLKTFTIAKWFAKPRAIGAMTCAQYGWINNGMDTIHCTRYMSKRVFVY